MTEKIYVHVMERRDGTEIRHKYRDEAVAQRLADNNRSLGFHSWVEVEEREDTYRDAFDSMMGDPMCALDGLIAALEV